MQPWLDMIHQTVAEFFTGLPVDYLRVYIGIMRYALPAMALLLILRCAWPLISFKREPEIWAWLNTANGEQIPIIHWENVIGRSKSCDVTIALSTVSRNHAVLTRYDDGSWTITDTNSKFGTLVNGKPVTICAIKDGDRITIGGIEFVLQLITKKQEQLQKELRARPHSGVGSMMNLLLLTVMQLCLACGYLLPGKADLFLPVVEGFGGILLCEWLLFLFYAMIRRTSFEVETLAFLLCSVGMAVIITVCPQEAVKQLAALALGVVAFLIIGWSLRDLERAKRFRYLATMAGLGFLVITLVFGREYYGARNWIVVGGVSMQLSELAKVCFVYAGASTMDRIMNKRNLFAFICYSVLICGCLALMNDFGTALIFFCAFLVIAYLRSGSMGTVALAITALALAGMLALRVAPHALKRFATWRHVWDDPLNKGYQQVQALMCIASGGLFGLGPGQGKLHRVFAADSDIVFATVSEEWGLLLALMLVCCIAAYGFFTIRSSGVARSSFYSIGGCTAASILLLQTMLNTLGTVDMLPFTGVTFPFLSNGGTSLIGAWALLAFVKAADTRQNASFAVKLNRKGGGKA